MRPSVMARALALAARGRFRVEPNPEVGAVVFSKGKIVAEGWHDAFGGPHAEDMALRMAGARAKGADLYVTLEPCSTHGKRPPCVEAILRSGVARVYVAHQDPSKVHGGQGIRKLRESGIQVQMMDSEAELESDVDLLGRFSAHLKSERSFVIAKWAMTLDGKIAANTGDSRWISNKESRRLVHRERDLADAVMVGMGTVLADDPELTCRIQEPLERGQPTRVIVDPRGDLPLDSRLVRTMEVAPLWVLTRPAGATKLKPHQDLGVRVEVIEDEPFPLSGLRRLRELGCHRVLVEGGSGLLTDLYEQRGIDQFMVFVAPKIIGGTGAKPPIAGAGKAMMSEALLLENFVSEIVDGDIVARGFARANSHPST